MIEVFAFSGLPVAVLGLGKSGLVAAESLQRGGAEVRAWDDSDEKRRARAAGLEIIGDIELLARTQREPAYVGITGTNGKSTTTSLIGHVLEVTGRDVAVGGNLGTPAL